MLFRWQLLPLQSLTERKRNKPNSSLNAHYMFNMQI
nr:MAG TPA: hypothetical protein [Caudoviricetes sp.]